MPLRYAPRLLALAGLLLALLALPGPAPAARAATAAGVPGPGDWPMYMANPARTGWNTDETALSPATAPHLRRKWVAQIGGPLVPAPAVVGDMIFEGSWDGNEYGINAADGSIRWQTAIGTTGTPPKQCKPNSAGVTSGAAVGGGLLYVGGGADNFYAIDPATGQPSWALYTGDSSPQGGSYNWASPLIVGDKVFSGMASFCDRPFIRGYLWSATAANGKDERRVYTADEGALGAGIWTSPTYDAAHNRIFVTTGSPGDAQGYVDSMVAIDLNTYTISDAWRIPTNQEVKDADWSTTPTLMSLSDGRLLVGAGNKNGSYYVFDADHLAAGPIWQYQAAALGDCPQCGEGVLASSVYHDGVIYVGGGHTTIDGAEVGGSVRAFDAATGALRWTHPTAGPVLASLAGANGVVVAVGDNQVHVINAADGATLFRFDLGTTAYGAPVIAHGVIYAPSLDGTLTAYEVPPELAAPAPAPPSGPTATPPPAPEPAPDAVQRVAGPAPAGGLYFAATGHTLAPPLRAYWERYGGLAQFGYPLTEPFTETLNTRDPRDQRPQVYQVQYFERARFEYHPEYAGTPSEVLLGLLGVHFHDAEPPAAPRLDPGYSVLNGHNLGGAFRRYWEARGGLFVNGYPISEERDEVSPTDGKTYRVQYFERARFEYHPEYAGTDHEVLLGLLGSQLLRERGWIK
jgi:outer membrane protein assembly factor BamB